jgi:hypothetical protein
MYVKRVDATKVRNGYVRNLFVSNFERVDTAEVCKDFVRDTRLVATPHVKLLDATKVDEGRVCYFYLIAVRHIERMNALKVCKGRVRDAHLVAVRHIECVDTT